MSRIKCQKHLKFALVPSLAFAWPKVKSLSESRKGKGKTGLVPLFLFLYLVFLVIFVLLISDLTCTVLREYSLNNFNPENLFNGPRYYQFLQMFFLYQKKKYILQLLGTVFYLCQLVWVSWSRCSNLWYHFYSFVHFFWLLIQVC